MMKDPYWPLNFLFSIFFKKMSSLIFPSPFLCSLPLFSYFFFFLSLFFLYRTSLSSCLLPVRDDSLAVSSPPLG